MFAGGQRDTNLASVGGKHNKMFTPIGYNPGIQKA
jgi:hypothetical protein